MKRSFPVYATYNTSNQEYQGSDRAIEGGDPEGACSYDRGDEGMAAGFWI